MASEAKGTAAQGMGVAWDQAEELAGKYLTFFLAKEQFGLAITKVREIIGVLDITPVPQTAPFMLGVINLRGKVIPVIDLRLRFGLEFREFDERTCVIVVEVEDDSEVKTLISFVVDQVNEVIQAVPEDLEKPPAVGGGMDTSYILGMAKTGSGVKILLDIDRIVLDSRMVLG